MKAALVILVSTLCLAGCHATRQKNASPAGPAAASTLPSSKLDKSVEKSRDTMLDKSMNVQDEHWASSPAKASTATVPANAASAGKPSSNPPGTPANGNAH